MKLAGSYRFEAPLPLVWEALFDPEVLAKTLPGCEKLERQGDTFLGEINVKMGPVQGKFQGKVDISDVVPQESYRMVIDGRGPAGFVKATAQLSVRASDATASELQYDSDVQVGGRIASVGQRLLDASSRAIAKQSLDGLHEQIKAMAAARAAALEATAAGAPANTASANTAVPPPRTDEPPAPDRPGSAGGDEPSGAVAPRGDAAASGGASRAAAPAGVSQAAFAMGVAKEVTKELLPARTLLIVVGIILATLVIYALLRAT